MTKLTKEQKNRFALFACGFVQVFFVAINTVFLAKAFILGVLIASFMISIVWSFNVKKIAFGNRLDRFVYASGASIGSVAGLLLSLYFTVYVI